MSLLGSLLKFSWQLQEHYWGDWSLQRWCVILLTVYAGLSALRWLPEGWPGTALAIACVLLLVGFGVWARGCGFVIYQPGEDFGAALPASPVLLPSDKVLLRATGTFEVEGKERYFANLQAYFRSFATREHAVMALVPPQRFLLIGQRPKAWIGMWYIFFNSGTIRTLGRGVLWFGARKQPAIRVQYQGPKHLQSVYLVVDEPTGLERVLADLRRDAPQSRDHTLPDNLIRRTPA